MHDTNELIEEARKALAEHAARQQAAVRRDPMDPHGFGAERQDFYKHLKERFAPDAQDRAAATESHAGRYAAMLASWRASQPRCPNSFACAGRCNSDPLAAWEEASMEHERFEAEKMHREDLARMRAAVPGRLQALGAPLRSVKTWVEGTGETPAMRGVRPALEALAMAPETRKHVLFLLCGISGAGKTTAATWAVAEHLASPAGQPRKEGQPLPGFFLLAADIARGGIYGAQAKEMLESAYTADILVVDDTGSEVVAERGPWLAMFDAMLNARYGDFLPTIITSNMSPEAFFVQYGERIKSRFREAGRIVNCGTVDFRKEGLT